MDGPLDTALLHTFVAVAEARSFTGAGRQLNLSQSAVSAQVFRLEEQIGSALLVRNTRNVGLTEQGQTLLGYARAILNLSVEARARLGPGKTYDGKLRIGVSEDFVGGWLPEAMRRFSASRKGLLLNLIVDIGDNLFRRYSDGEFDVVIGSRCAFSHSGTTLWREPLAWAIGRHELLPEGEVPLACFPDPCPFREAALKALTLANIAYRIACESPSVAGVRAFARAGIAIAPLPRGAIGDGLRELALTDGLPTLPDIEFVMMHDAQHAAAVEFSETVFQEVDSAHRTTMSRITGTRSSESANPFRHG